MPKGIITKNRKKHSVRTQEIRERTKYPTLKKMNCTPKVRHKTFGGHFKTGKGPNFK